MTFKKFTPTFILGTIAVVFGYDTLAEVFGSHATISEATTNWLASSPSHYVVFFSGVAVLCMHFVYGYYKRD